MSFPIIDPVPGVAINEIRTFRAENFPVAENKPWLDCEDWPEQIERRLEIGQLTVQQAAWCRKWASDGYLVIPKMFCDQLLDDAWRQYENLIESGELIPQEDHAISVLSKLPGRVLNPHFKVEAFKSILFDVTAQEIVSVLLDVKALPFQTIAGHKGSEQKAHSDSIHMTTYPQGYLVANWVAFEDIKSDSGPLEFYPGSHRLPYTYSKQCGIGVEEAQAGYGAYHEKYEPFIQRLIAENGLQPRYFNAEKGDVLFWHANLLHGGSRIADASLSRKALVSHYFAEGCICYHDYTGSPSHLLQFPKLGKEEFDAESYLKCNADVAAAGVDAYTHYVQHGYNEGRRVR